MTDKKETIDRATACRCLANYISASPKGVDFLDIETFFTWIGFDYKGSKVINLTANPTVAVWYGWNIYAISILNEILRKDYVLKSSSAIIYNIKGHISQMPVIYSGLTEKYDVPHWAPMRIIAKNYYF